MKNYIKKNLLFCLSAFLLASVIALCITGTVIGQSRINDEEMETFYQMKEDEMVCEVRRYLNENGFRNSGVALTRVTDAEGNREYTLTVHHDRIDVMSDEERNDLKNRLSAFDFLTEECSFRHEFLIVDK
ncbi:MAG: hypothetical protein LUG83_06485 [Lachnospiraceae bacterium]|nr:hypothetical protein [Lachnospiraceae bacterium]